MVVKRPKLSLAEEFYLPAIVTGLAITLKHLRKLVSGKTKATMQYPEERWDSQLPPWYRGAPALVKDEHGKERCVACQLCEFICPPRAITDRIMTMNCPAKPTQRIEAPTRLNTHCGLRTSRRHQQPVNLCGDGPKERAEPFALCRGNGHMLADVSGDEVEAYLLKPEWCSRPPPPPTNRACDAITMSNA
jgi:ferredoxin